MNLSFPCPYFLPCPFFCVWGSDIMDPVCDLIMGLTKIACLEKQVSFNTKIGPSVLFSYCHHDIFP